MAQNAAESVQSDVALADAGMAISVGAERRLRIVGMD